jgi:hypothetical protein
MSTLSANQAARFTSFSDNTPKTRRAAYGDEPSILADIYNDETNIAIWQRKLPAAVQRSVKNFLTSQATFNLTTTVASNSILANVNTSLGHKAESELCENIAELVDMFCYLFELKAVGLRLSVLDSAMCPRFHVDRIPCRLATTFQGVATEWLPHETVNREKLGRGSNGKPDSQSGLYHNQHDIQQLKCGDVALLKGEIWEGNTHAGLVHRSPALSAAERRLLLTLDFSN